MFWKFIQKLWKRPVKNSYFTKVAGSFPKTYLILSSLAIFQRFYIIFKKSFKTQSFVKFPKQLFQEHISLTISVTVNLIFFLLHFLSMYGLWQLHSITMKIDFGVWWTYVKHFTNNQAWLWLFPYEFPKKCQNNCFFKQKCWPKVG